MLRQSVRNRSLTVLALVVCSASLIACQVPVFRYALENWEPDRLEVFVIHDGPLSDAEQQLCDRLEEASFRDEVQTNFRWHAVDVSVAHPTNSLDAFVIETCGDQPLPQLQVYYSMASGPQPGLAWATAFNAPAIDRLLTSPKREEVAKRLLDGQSGVWVLLRSGKEAADKQAEDLLRRELEKQPNEIALPSLTDLANEEKFNESLGVDLRVEFSLLTLDRTEESEAFFRSMLINTESDLTDYDEPIAIPIYGRGRTFYALVGPGITPDNIAENCRFICGACSCEIKSQNPGRDLLLAANWRQVEPGNWVNETPLPALTGIGQLDNLGDDETISAEESSGSRLTPTATSGEATIVAALDTDSMALVKDDASQTPSQDDSRAVATELAAEPDAMITVKSTTLPMVVLGWIGLLLCLGLGFTVWRRAKSSE